MTTSRKKSSPSDSTRRILGAFSSTSSKDLQHGGLKVPNIIHFIWAGGLEKPSKIYIKSMLMWQDQNPQSKIYFWVDKKTSGENLISSYPELFNKVAQKLNATNREDGKKHNCNPSKIQIMDIEEDAKEDNSSDYKVSNKFVRYEIDRLKANYGASSDLLRYRIMYKYGGAYFDFDIKPGSLVLDKDIFDKTYTGNQLWLYPFSQNSSVIGNDVFISTAKNPYMALIYEIAESNYRIGSTQSEKQSIINNLKNKAQSLGVEFSETSNEFKVTNSALNLLSDLYGYDDNKYIFGVTPFKTGPSCVRIAVAKIIASDANYNDEINEESNSKLELDLEEIEDLNSERSFEIDEKVGNRSLPVSKDPGVHLLNKGDIQPFPQSGLTWVNHKIVRSDNVDSGVNAVVNTILFEVNELGYMRLIDHIDNIASSCRIGNRDASIILLEKLDQLQIQYEKIRGAQYTFEHSLILEFYEKHSINYKDAIFPSFSNDDILYQVPMLKILSISKFKNAMSDFTRGQSDSSMEDKQKYTYSDDILRGLRFLNLATEHAKTAIDNKLPVDLQFHIATYLDFLKNQLDVYVEFMNIVLEPVVHDKAMLEDLKNTIHSINDEITTLLDPMKSLLNQEDIFHEDIPTNRLT